MVSILGGWLTIKSDNSWGYTSIYISNGSGCKMLEFSENEEEKLNLKMFILDITQIR